MKKFGLVFMILLLSVGMLFANGKSEDKQVAADEKIIIETFEDLSPQFMKAALEEAGLADKVEFRTVPQNQYESKLKILIGSNDVGDIICMDAPNIAYYADLGALEPLDNFWDKEDFKDLVPSSKQAVTWNGNIWAAPLNESNCVLYYNKKMFADAGITNIPNKVEDAWNMEQLLEAAKKLTKKNENGDIEVYGIMPQMFSVDQKNEGMTYTQMLWPWWFGADIISPDGTTVDGYFNSPESKEALQFYSDLFNKYKVAPSSSMSNFFSGRKVAMWINGPWMVGVWKNNFPEFYESGDWGAMPLPKARKAASNSGSWNLAITKNSKNKELAYKVLNAITNTKGSKIYCSNTGNLPARASTLKDTDMTAVPYNIIQQQLLLNSTARPVTPNYPLISEALMNAYNNVAFGQDVDTAFNEAVSEMNDALN